MQKYQVFINDHLLSIAEKVESNQQFPSEFYLKQPDGEEIETIVKWLLEENTRMKATLITKKPTLLWKLFQQQFNLIEAAGGLVRNQKGEILFIHRLQKWDLPKGKVEKGESPTEAAVREVEEECGITALKIGKELPNSYHIYDYKDSLVLKRTYWFEMDYAGEEELIPQKEEGIEEVVWVNPKKMQKQKENTYASLRKMIERS